MAAFNFPDTAGKPTDGSFTYAAPDGTVYKWNGYAWQVQESSGGGGGGGGGDAARVATQVIPPSPAEDGDMYWCTDDGRLYIYYTEDATDPNPNPTSQWVDASPEDGLSGVERLIAGNNIILSPEDGKGIVTVSSTGGGGGPTTPGVRYQEGTWVPKMIVGVSPYDTLSGYQSNTSLWTRVGNVVTLWAKFNNAAGRGGTDLIETVGLPYPVETGLGAVGSSMYQSIADSSFESLSPFCSKDSSDPAHASTGRVLFYRNYAGNNENWAPLTLQELGTSGTKIIFSVSYITDDTTYNPFNSAFITEDIEGTGGSGGGGGGTTVNYNGTSAWGSISSTGEALGGFNYTVNYAGDGTYDVSFVTAMPNVNYSVTATSANSMCQALNLTTTGFRIRARNSSGDLTNGAVYFAVHSANAIAPQSGVGADAWGRISGTAGIIDGFNVKSSGRVEGATTGTFEIEFTTPMPTDKYSVVITPTNSNYYGGVSGVTREGFKVYLRNNDNGGALGNSEFAFTVHASSTVTPTYTWTRDGTTLKPANNGDTLEAGSAEFAGRVVTEGSNSAYFQSNRTDANTLTFSGQLNGTQTAGIKADGSATFASTVSTGNPVGNGYTSGAIFGGDGVVASYVSNSNAVTEKRIYVYNGSTSTYKASIDADGSASFGDGSTTSIGLTVKNNSTSNTTLNLINSNPAVGRLIRGVNSGTECFTLESDGSAFFAGDIAANNVTFNLEADDDTKYTTTTDVDGNETRVYNGATLDVKEMLLNFQAKIQTLEAAKAALEARVVTLETQQSSGN